MALRWLQTGFLPDDVEAAASRSDSSSGGVSSSLVLTPCPWQSSTCCSIDACASSNVTTDNKKKNNVEVSAVHGGGWGFAVASDRRRDVYVWGDCAQDYLLPPSTNISSPPPLSCRGVGGDDDTKGKEEEGEGRKHSRVPNGEGGEVLRLLMKRARDDDDEACEGGANAEDGDAVVVVAAAGWAHVVAAVTPGATAAAAAAATQVRCAGWNSHGQSNPPPTLDPSSALNMQPLVHVRSLAAGERHTLAVCGGARVWAWGDNSCGQLGLGGGGGGSSKKSGVISSSLSPAPTLVKLPSTSSAVAIAAGARHSVVIDHDGTVYTFGWGLYGQCGHGDSEDIYAPTPCEHLLGIPCRAAAAGSAHTAVLTRDGGGLYTFGSNQFGQLGCVGDGENNGDGDNGDGDDGDGDDGDGDDGDGENGEIGENGDAFCKVGGTSAIPLLIDLDGFAREVSCGSRHTAAVVVVVVGEGEKDMTTKRRRRNLLFAWGWNAHGQLGLGDRRDRSAPSRVFVPPSPLIADSSPPDVSGGGGGGGGGAEVSVSRVSCGWWHTVVGVLA